MAFYYVILKAQVEIFKDTLIHPQVYTVNM